MSHKKKNLLFLFSYEKRVKRNLTILSLSLKSRMILILLGTWCVRGYGSGETEMWQMIATMVLLIFTIGAMIEHLMLLNSWHKPEWTVSPIDACNAGDWVEMQIFFTGISSICGIYLSIAQQSTFVPITGIALFLLAEALRISFRKEPWSLRFYKPSS